MHWISDNVMWFMTPRSSPAGERKIGRRGSRVNVFPTRPAASGCGPHYVNPVGQRPWTRAGMQNRRSFSGPCRSFSEPFQARLRSFTFHDSAGSSPDASA